jgi:orotate phosphoribosyltransferase
MESVDLLDRTRVRLTQSQALAELRDDILRVAYLPPGRWEASEDATSGYFDKYAFQTRPAILRRLGRFLAELVPRETDRVAAPALGAVALGAAVALEIGLPLVIVKTDAELQTQRPLEGEIYPGEIITLIEDVVITGTRALGAAKLLRATGAEVREIIAVLDRSGGAPEKLRGEPFPYRALISSSELGLAPPRAGQ